MARPKSIEFDVNTVGTDLDTLVNNIGALACERATVDQIFNYLERRLGSAKRKALAKVEVPDQFKLGMTLPDALKEHFTTYRERSLGGGRGFIEPEDLEIRIAGGVHAGPYVAPAADTDEVDFIEE